MEKVCPKPFPKPSGTCVSIIFISAEREFLSESGRSRETGSKMAISMVDSKIEKRMIIDSNELRVGDVPVVGGKGANLGELTSSGFPVPHAFVLTTVAYDYFIKSSKIMPKIMEAIKEVDPDSDDTLVAASKKIQDLFAQHEIPADH